MDEDDVIAICDYLLHRAYPKGFTRVDKRSLRQKSNSFVCEIGQYLTCRYGKHYCSFESGIRTSHLYKSVWYQ